jgi:hypothetical protein
VVLERTTPGSEIGKVTPVEVIALLSATLLSSLAPTVAVLSIVVAVGVDKSTLTTSVNTCDPSVSAKVAMLHETVPVPPTAGVVQLHPGGLVSDTNVVWAGVASVIVTVCAVVPATVLDAVIV